MAEKQGEIKKITQKQAPEFKGEGEEVKKEVKQTSVITMLRGKPHRVYFENGKQVKTEAI